LEVRHVRVGETRLAKTKPLSDVEARAVLACVDEVIVAKGKNARRLAAKDATLDDLRGPTGNIRAPIIRKGRRLLVGFHPDSLESLLKT
jgi:arsenate reductase-like glutaredoxin family protein